MQWRYFKELSLKKSLLTERRKGSGLSVKPERAGSDNGASDPFGGYWTRLGIKVIPLVFFPLVQVGLGWRSRNKSNFVCFHFLLAAHSPLSASKA